MKLRTIIFWIHLGTGVAAGLVVLMMSVSGVLLTYEMQLNQWALRGYRANPSPGEKPLPISALLAKVKKASPELEPSSLRVFADPREPALLNLPSEGRRQRLYVDRYSGEVLGDGSTRMRSFMTSVMYWHRWFALTGDNRAIGRAITGACNLGFLFLVASGFYLWFPRDWSRQALRNVTWFRTGLRSKARDFNWHNVIGFWIAFPLVIVVSSAAVISYSWAGDLIDVLTGESPPERSSSHSSPPASVTTAAFVVGDAPSLDALVERASTDIPDWNILTLTLPESDSEPVGIAIDRGTGRQYQKRTTFEFDPHSGEVLDRESFSDRPRERQWRTWMRFAHTGEHYGFLGQTLAGIASLGACFLVWTGLALSWRRFF